MLNLLNVMTIDTGMMFVRKVVVRVVLVGVYAAVIVEQSVALVLKSRTFTKPPIYRAVTLNLSRGRCTYTVVPSLSL